MVQQLLLKEADKDALGGQERTPLCLAAHRGHVAVVLALLTAGADVSVRCGVFRGPALKDAAALGPC